MQQLAQDAHREREWELTRLIDLVPGHLWRLRPDGEPTFFNQRMVDDLGLDATRTVRPGKTRLQVIIDSVHPDDAAGFGAKLRKCLTTGESFAMRYRMRRADGGYRWMSGRAEPKRDQRGQIVEWHGLCLDIEHEVDEERCALSIADDTIRSLAAIVTSAQAAEAWLTADPPNIARARRSVVRIVRDAWTAAEPNAAAGAGIDKKVD
jgi:hypothetical protein